MTLGTYGLIILWTGIIFLILMPILSIMILGYVAIVFVLTGGGLVLYEMATPLKKEINN